LWPRGFGHAVDWPSVVIGLAAALALFRFKAGVIAVVLGAGVAGLAARMAQATLFAHI
jgi:chromate transporter